MKEKKEKVNPASAVSPENIKTRPQPPIYEEVPQFTNEELEGLCEMGCLLMRYIKKYSPKSLIRKQLKLAATKREKENLLSLDAQYTIFGVLADKFRKVGDALRRNTDAAYHYKLAVAQWRRDTHQRLTKGERAMLEFHDTVNTPELKRAHAVATAKKLAKGEELK